MDQNKSLGEGLISILQASNYGSPARMKVDGDGTIWINYQTGCLSEPFILVRPTKKTLDFFQIPLSYALEQECINIASSLENEGYAIRGYTYFREHPHYDKYGNFLR